MRTALIALLSFVFIAFGNAQNTPSANTKIMAGIGLGQTATAFETGQSNYLPFSIQVQHKLSSKFSLGLFYSRVSYNGPQHIVSDGLLQQLKHTYQQAALKAAFHIDRIEKLDLYGGMQLGLNFSKFEASQGSFDYFSNHLGLQPNSTKLLYTGFVGASYDIAYGFSIYSELGFGSTLLNTGIGYRF
ncbi:MAG: hypothetical protein D6816_07285 [Bacteroidetes bacterium]|nr:MAG: hypothetical protein D6816_07285 [Bacteroidota bacterium]